MGGCRGGDGRCHAARDSCDVSDSSASVAARERGGLDERQLEHVVKLVVQMCVERQCVAVFSVTYNRSGESVKESWRASRRITSTVNATVTFCILGLLLSQP